MDLSGVLTVDCGATTTLTVSLNNMTDVRPIFFGVTMKSSHVYDRTGTCWPISTQAYYVKELNQDLLAGRGLTCADYRLVLDKHDSIAGIYPVGDDGTIDAANSFPFICVH